MVGRARRLLDQAAAEGGTTLWGEDAAPHLAADSTLGQAARAMALARRVSGWP